MKLLNKFSLFICMLFLASLIMLSCEGPEGPPGPAGADATDGTDGTNGADGADGMDGVDGVDANRGVEPLVSISPEFPGLQVETLLTSSKGLVNDDESVFRLGGSADGAGFLKDGENYHLLVNLEDHYSVARITFDALLNPIDGRYLLSSGVADYARQCSATMWEAAIHGGTDDLFLSASESFHYDVKGIDPYMDPSPTSDFGLDALGEFSWENAVSLPQGTYAGSTVIIGGDDDSSGSEGQVTMYYSDAGDADLTGGKIYVLRFKEVSNGTGGAMPVTASTTYSEEDLDFNVSYEVEFVEIVDGASMTVSEMEDACVAVNASQFMRVEDVDYQKGSDANARNLYIAVTGRGPDQGTYNDWGTIYKLTLNDADPLQGTLTQIVSGNTTGINNGDGNLALLQSPDNICVTENYVYIQEDPNSFSRNHSAYIYQTALDGTGAKVVLSLLEDPELGADEHSGEFGALLDVSDKLGIADAFILCLQPHYWNEERFQGVDGHTITGTEPNCDDFCREDTQGSQVVLLTGLPR